MPEQKDRRIISHKVLSREEAYRLVEAQMNNPNVESINLYHDSRPDWHAPGAECDCEPEIFLREGSAEIFVHNWIH